MVETMSGTSSSNCTKICGCAGVPVVHLCYSDSRNHGDVHLCFAILRKERELPQRHHDTTAGVCAMCYRLMPVEWLSWPLSLNSISEDQLLLIFSV
jgi:hypothetical protein